MIVTGDWSVSRCCWAGVKFAAQYMDLFGIKRYLIALFPLAIIVLVSMATPNQFLSTGQALLVALTRRDVRRILLIQTKTHQSGMQDMKMMRR